MHGTDVQISPMRVSRRLPCNLVRSAAASLRFALAFMTSFSAKWIRSHSTSLYKTLRVLSRQRLAAILARKRNPHSGIFLRKSLRRISTVENTFVNKGFFRNLSMPFTTRELPIGTVSSGIVSREILQKPWRRGSGF